MPKIEDDHVTPSTVENIYEIVSSPRLAYLTYLATWELRQNVTDFIAKISIAIQAA